MGAKTYDKAVKFHEFLLKSDLPKEMNVNLLERLLEIHIGSDKITLEKYKKALVRFGFLQIMRNGNFKVRKKEAKSWIKQKK